MMETNDQTGYVHSSYAGSVVDGPGMRYVLWTTGCHFRCLYCHNPDTWHRTHGTPTTVSQVMAKINQYRRFMSNSQGGVTISGGEPLVQAGFVRQILRACKQQGIHTALDTNGFLGDCLSDTDLQDIDLVLLDIKSWVPAIHHHVTGQEVEPVLAFAKRLARLRRPTWVRFVLVPGLTDEPANVDGLAGFIAGLPNVERVEVLPFHQMGAAKWEQLEQPYLLRDTAPPSPELLTRVWEQFRAHGISVARYRRDQGSGARIQE